MAETALGGARGRDAGLLLERERELEAFARALDRLAEGVGSFLLVEGPAGIGKSRLLAESADLAGGRQLSVRAARAGQLEREMPFGVARQLLEPVIERSSAAERSRLLTGSAGLALTAFGRQAPERASLESDPFAPIHGLYWLLSNLAEARPIVLIVDDLHWADPQSLRWLDYVTRRLIDLSVVVFAGIRSGEPGQPAELEPLRLEAELIHPAPLSRDAVDELITTELRSDPTREFSDACAKATAGNPFFLVEILRILRADAITPGADAAKAIADLGPESVARYVLLRLGRFGDEAISLARAIAVLGSAPQLRHASQLAELSEDRAGKLCDRLREAEILAPGLPIDFVHPLVRSAIYRDLPEVERSARHRRAAEILDSAGGGAGEIASHLMACAPNGDAWVVARLREAANSAVAAGAYDGAQTYLERALAEPPEEELRVRFELGLALIETDPVRAPEVLAEVAQATGDPNLRIDAFREAGFAYTNAPDFERSVGCFARLLKELPEDDREQTLLVESQLYCLKTISTGWTQANSDHIRAVAAGVEATTRGECLVRQALAFDRFLGCTPVDEVVELAASFPPPPIELRLRVITPLFSCFILAWSGRWDQARLVMSYFADVAREEAELVVVGLASGLLAYLDRCSGRLADSEAVARTAWEIASATAPNSYLGWNAIVNLLATLIAKGNLEEAERLADGIDLSAGYDLMPTLPAPLEVRGYLRIAQGATEDGLQDLLEYGAGAQRLRLNNPAHSPWEQEAALALASLGRTAEADELIAEAERRTRAFGAPHVLGAVLRSRALLQSRKRQIETLRESVGLLETHGAPHELARSLLELGASLRRDGQRSDSREPLRRALELAHQSGAGGIESRARDELAAAGSRPRNVFRTGVASLTASELRAARLAAEGLSNVEIAQRLFVSRKTVEKHLGNVYMKLEVSGREGLTGALGDNSSTLNQSE